MRSYLYPRQRALKRRAAFTPGASVDTRFDSGLYLVGGSRYVSLLDVPGFTASGGVNGTIETAGGIEDASTPRINTAGERGLVVEGERENQIVHSGDLTNAAWGGFRTTKTTGDDAPRASETYTLCEADETNANGSAAGIQNFAVSSGEKRTYSIYAKVGVAPGILNLRMTNSADFADYASAWFDIANGTVGTVVDSGSSVSLVSGDIKQVGLGEYRCSITFTADASVTMGARTYIVDADGGLSVTAGKRVQLWGGQFEQDDLSSYIPTAGSPVTRTADSITLTMANLDLASDQDWTREFADGTTDTISAVSGTLTIPTSDKVISHSYAVAS